jgi:hypothetical protein
MTPLDVGFRDCNAFALETRERIDRNFYSISLSSITPLQATSSIFSKFMGWSIFPLSHKSVKFPMADLNIRPAPCVQDGTSFELTLRD